MSFSQDGSRLAVGAINNSGNGFTAGQVRVYDWNGSNWVQVGADIDGETTDNLLGWSVSLSAEGTRLAAGAPNNAGNGAFSGHARVYDWDGSAWVQVGIDIDGEAPDNFSGRSVSLSSDGGRLAMGLQVAW